MWWGSWWFRSLVFLLCFFTWLMVVLCSRVLRSVVGELVIPESDFYVLLFHMADTGFAFAGAYFYGGGGISTSKSPFDLIFENKNAIKPKYYITCMQMST